LRKPTISYIPCKNYLFFFFSFNGRNSKKKMDQLVTNQLRNLLIIKEDTGDDRAGLDEFDQLRALNIDIDQEIAKTKKRYSIADDFVITPERRREIAKKLLVLEDLRKTITHEVALHEYDIIGGKHGKGLNPLGVGYPLEGADPLEGAEDDEDELDDGPFEKDGYYPLYSTFEAARDASPTNSVHIHVLDGTIYYMPDGVEFRHGSTPTPTPTSAPVSTPSPTSAPVSTSDSVTKWLSPTNVNVYPVENQRGCEICWLYAATSAVRYLLAAEGESYNYPSCAQYQCVTNIGCQQEVNLCSDGLNYLNTNGLVPAPDYCSNDPTDAGNPCNTNYIESQNIKETSCCGTNVTGGTPCGDAGPCPTPTTPTFDSKVYYTGKAAEQDDITTIINKLPISPVLIAVDGSSDAFVNYSGGILTPTKSTSLDHVVLVVGYNASDNTFTVRNSWGPGWGENGYFRLRARPNNYGLGMMYATDIYKLKIL
jgi:C1A family cysteine protease